MSIEETNKFKMFVFGLGKAGKTALISTLTGDKVVSNTRPTLTIAVSKYFVENVEFSIWDAPGQINFRYLWPQGYKKASLLFYVLDTSNPDCFEEAKEEFDKVIENTEKLNCVFCYHKMDLQDAEDNFNKASDIFKLGDIPRRKVIAFKTSIFHEDSIKQMRKVLEEIAMGIFF